MNAHEFFYGQQVVCVVRGRWRHDTRSSGAQPAPGATYHVRAVRFFTSGTSGLFLKLSGLPENEWYDARGFAPREPEGMRVLREMCVREKS